MTLELAIRCTEMLLAVAIIQRSAEHISRGDHLIFAPQLVLGLALICGLGREVAVIGLMLLSMAQLYRFNGPYNGGADKMALLILTCLTIAHQAPDPLWAEMAMAYLAVQLVLSYAVSGWVKVTNPDWRRGAALRDVFAFSAYPVSRGLRGWAERPAILLTASLAVIAFELAFPLALFHPLTLLMALAMAAIFHLVNASILGLNRFFWIWISAYPALIWFQARIF